MDVFDSDTLSPLLFTGGPYHKSKATTWESIDSLYLPYLGIYGSVSPQTAAKWNRNSDGPLMLFQMTASKPHPVNALELAVVVSKLEFLDRLEHVMFVFVVPKELVGTFKRQPIVLVTAVGTDSVLSIRGIGRATSALLCKYGIKTIDDLEKEVNLRENVKKQKTTTKTEKPGDEYPDRWAQLVKLWKQHELSVKYGEKVAAITQYVGSWDAS